MTRFLVLVVLLGATAVLLWAHSQPEHVPDHASVASYPLSLPGWQGQEIKIDERTREVLGDGDFAERIYRNGSGPWVDLFLAYFPTQRTGSTIHSPKNCLPGSGWTPLPEFAGRITLSNSKGESFPVNRYIVAKGLDRDLVLYWYQSHGRMVASEYAAKFYLVNDAIRMNRSDGALVRLVTPMGRDESTASAEKRAVDFAQSIIPSLDGYIPR